MAGSNPSPSPPADFDALWQAASSGQADAQYEVGMHYMRESNLRRGRRWLEKAANQGQSRAMTELGLMHLHGVGTRSDPGQAAAMFAQSSDAEARLHYANLLWAGLGVPADRPRAQKLIIEAASQGHSEALCLLGMCHAMSDGPDAQSHASTCLEAAAFGGNAVAQYCFSERLRTGVGVAQDDEAAAYWRAEAERSGRVYLADSASYLNPGLHEQPDRRAVETLQQALHWPTIEFAVSSPPEPGQVRSVQGALSDEICFYLVNLAAPYLRPSLTVHPETGQAVRSEMRSSSGMSMHPALEDIVVLLAKQKLASIAGMAIENAEPFAFLRYRGGEEYRAHYDYVDPDSGEARYQLKQFGQRICTVFAYLSTPEGGGQTHFPRLDVSVDPVRGQAVCFRNTDLSGGPDRDSLHASLPVTGGEKWLATLWLRERQFHATFS